MEPNRIWREPIIELKTRSNCYTKSEGELFNTFHMYDEGNRRWYQINIKAGGEWSNSELWAAETVAIYISTYYHQYGKQTPYNVIYATSEDGPMTFDTQPDHLISRSPREKLQYHSSPANLTLPFVSLEELLDKEYLGPSCDKCEWEGKECVFKRVEYKDDVERMNREIRSREKLFQHLRYEAKNITEANNIMEQRYCIIPILALVLEQKQNPKTEDHVIGILMRFGGPDLETLSKRAFQRREIELARLENPKMKESQLELKVDRYIPTYSSLRIPLPPIAAPKPHRDWDDVPPIGDPGTTLAQLQALARGVCELEKTGVRHGDIAARNVAYSKKEDRLLLFDFGSEEECWMEENDGWRLGQLFLWCVERCGWGEREKRGVRCAVGELEGREERGGDGDGDGNGKGLERMLRALGGGESEGSGGRGGGCRAS